MSTFYLLGGASIALLIVGYILKPPVIMSGLVKGGRGDKAGENNGGRIKSFRENVATVANLIGIIAGILAIIQFFAGKS